MLTQSFMEKLWKMLMLSKFYPSVLFRDYNCTGCLKFRAKDSYFQIVKINFMNGFFRWTYCIQQTWKILCWSSFQVKILIGNVIYIHQIINFFSHISIFKCLNIKNFLLFKFLSNFSNMIQKTWKFPIW